jgi:hypothetical protein
MSNWAGEVFRQVGGEHLNVAETLKVKAATGAPVLALMSDTCPRGMPDRG